MVNSDIVILPFIIDHDEREFKILYLERVTKNLNWKILCGINKEYIRNTLKPLLPRLYLKRNLYVNT